MITSPGVEHRVAGPQVVARRRARACPAATSALRSPRAAPSSSRSVRSTITTASAPSGIGAPVKIRIASPGRERRGRPGGRRPPPPPPAARTGSPRLAPGGVGGPHRVAVHRRVGERRHVLRRGDRLGQHAARPRPSVARPARGAQRRHALEHVGAAPPRAGSHGGVSRCPGPARSRRATRGTRGRGRRGRGPARRWPAGSRACCRCRSGPRRTCSRSTSSVGEEHADGVGELDLAAGARLHLRRSASKIAGREHVAAHARAQVDGASSGFGFSTMPCTLSRRVARPSS